jgi:hypothetical protein
VTIVICAGLRLPIVQLMAAAKDALATKVFDRLPSSAATAMASSELHFVVVRPHTTVKYFLSNFGWL